ncbi:MAG: SRPBCC domain-containing protein [Alphaproteobacteria bacterium]|nr:MAG: SRPBCC domain-containing protein [Alphaproteobacteria bacterium]
MRERKMTEKLGFAVAALMVVLVGGTFSRPASAAPDESAPVITPVPSRAYEVTLEVALAASPAAVWETITGDISGWWDHRFSERPAAFFIDARPGGGFFEYFDADGKNGVRHAVVLRAEKERSLVFEGPLGFLGDAVSVVTNWTLTPISGDRTRLAARISVSGLDREGNAEALAGVWHHFLVERLAGYLAAGCRGGAPCAAFP